MSFRTKIISELLKVAHEQDKPLKPITDDLALTESGLDSLCLAILVVRLGDSLGVDPFSADGEGHFPVTVGDFVKFYENAAQ